MAQSAIPLKRKADMPNVPSIPHGSFAEYSEECIRGNCRGHLINACVVRISRGNEEKNPFGFEPKILSAPSCKVRKVKRHSEANTIRDTRLLTLDT